MPIFKADESYTIINDDLEYVFTNRDLDYIKKRAKDGKMIEVIAKELERDEWEVLWAYVHLIRRGNKLPALGYRRNQVG